MSSSAAGRPTRAHQPLEPAEVLPPKRGLPAWLMSATFHFTVLIVLSVLVRVVPRGAADEADRTGGIVLVRGADAQREYFSEDEQQSTGGRSASATGAQTASPLPSLNDIQIDLAGALPSSDDFGAVGDSLGDSLPGADGLLTGPEPSTFTGNQTQTGVFGVQGVGSKFVYVFDRSRSMSGYGGRPLAAAKGELIASLASLKSTHQFQIVFYNKEPHVFNPWPDRQPTMIFGKDRDKELATEFVSRVVADGGTEHMNALKLAVNMGPDVIFFLTDAEEPRLSEDDLSLIQRWNRAAASINTIEFGSGPFRGGDNFLVKLARQNHGRHVYVDVTRLPFRK